MTVKLILNFITFLPHMKLQFCHLIQQVPLFKGDMHLKDHLGSFVRVGYRIPVPDFYLVLHGLRCKKALWIKPN